MKVKLACCAALLLGLLVSPAMATIMVEITPGFQQIGPPPASTQVQILADIPEVDAVVGWGMDIDLLGATVTFSDLDVVINPLLWEPVFTPDGDGLGAVLKINGFEPVWGDNVLLATVTFHTTGPLGVTGLQSGANDPLLEGFALAEPIGQFAQVQWGAAAIEVIPEPASLLLLALGALLRRR